MSLHAPKSYSFFVWIIYVVVLTTGISCNKVPAKAIDYIAIQNRDTAYLSLTIHEQRFFGKLVVRKPGAVVDSGTVRGKIKENLLLGDYEYVPHGARHSKRKGFALQDSSGYLVRGTGLQEIYMGIPYYIEHSLTFPQDGFIFQIVEDSY